jgi:hypothetical protein
MTMPFEPLQPKAGFLERIRSLLLGMSAVLIVGLILFIIAFLVSQPTPVQEKEHRKSMAQEDFLRKYIYFSVTEAGYLRRPAGVQVVYVPALFVRIDNLSDKAIDRLHLRVIFQRQDKDICQGSALVPQLQAGESRDVAIKCLQSVGFGTVFQGLSLIQTTQDLEYKVWVSYEQDFT